MKQQVLPFPATQAPNRSELRSRQTKKTKVAETRPRRIKPLFSMDEEKWAEVVSAIAGCSDLPIEVFSKYATKSRTIKLSLPSALRDAMERWVAQSRSSYPSLIRISVESLKGNLTALFNFSKTETSKQAAAVAYPKVQFTPELLLVIGHQMTPERPAWGLCATLDATRQEVIMYAIKTFLGLTS